MAVGPDELSRTAMTTHTSHDTHTLKGKFSATLPELDGECSEGEVLNLAGLTGGAPMRD